MDVCEKQMLEVGLCQQNKHGHIDTTSLPLEIIHLQYYLHAAVAGEGPSEKAVGRQYQ